MAMVKRIRLPPVEMGLLREPKGRFQEMVRRLADAAMSVTHHDASENEEGYIHEMQSMERLFTGILRGYRSAETRRARQALARAEEREGRDG